MNRIFLILAVLLALSSLALSQERGSKAKETKQQGKAVTSNKHEEEIMKLEKEVAAARLRNDVATFDRYFADDFIGTSSSGVATERNPKNTNRARDINVTPAGEKYEANEIDELRVKIYGGDTAVSNYRRSIKARTKDGALRDIQLRETHVWVKQNGAWKKVAGQTTTISISQPQ